MARNTPSTKPGAGGNTRTGSTSRKRTAPAKTGDPRKDRALAKAETETVKAAAAILPEQPQVDMLKDIVAQLKAAGDKVTVKTNKRYSIIVVNGNSVAYVHTQTRNGARIEPALTAKQLPAGQARKLITPNAKTKTGKFQVSGVVPADKVDIAVAVIRLAAAEAAKAEAAKAEAKAAAKAKAKAAKAKAAPLSPEANEAAMAAQHAEDTDNKLDSVS